AYKLLLTVQACTQEHLAGTEPPPGGVECAQDDERVAFNAGLPTLYVEDLQAKQLGIARQPPFDPQATNLIERKLYETQQDLLERVFPHGQASGSSTWRIRASGLAFSQDPPPETVVVQLRTAVNPPLAGTEPEVTERDLSSQQVELTHQDNGEYVGTVEIGPSLIKTGTRFTRHEQPVQTTYSVSEIMGIGLDFDIREMMTTAAPAYGVTRRVGLFSERLRRARPKPPVQPEEAVNTLDNLRTFGFEPVDVRLERIGNPGLATADMVATVKVAHPPDVLILNQHGDHDGRLVLNQDFIAEETKAERPIPNPEYLSPGLGFTTPDSLRTLMLVSCDALDLHDYNNIYALISIPPDNPPKTFPPLHADTDRLAARLDYGGELWFRATGNGRTVLLGYNGPAPAVVMAEVLKEYGRELSRLSAALPAAERNRVEQYAWLSANLHVARIDPPGNRPLCMYTCAWDADYYYYIALKRYPGMIRETPDPKRIVGFRRIPRSEWNKDLEKWDKVPPAIAEEFQIP
ncbi:MAG: hypothetical protein AB1758_36200, partial [Candidatus Eremiobacterota bacterium]